jgi:hypothetical protein
MTRIVEWEGQPFALLVEGERGDYLVPPIVLDEDGAPVEGREVLAAIVESGQAVQMPVVRGANPGVLAEIDRRMAHLSDELGVPIGPAE